MEKIPFVIKPLSDADEKVLYYTGRHCEERTIDGMDYLIYNRPAFMQRVGRQNYGDRHPGHNVGYRPDPRNYPSGGPHISCFTMIQNPNRHIPPLLYKGDGGLVVAGAVVWAMPYGSFSDDAYCKTLLPSKEHIKQALEKAQGLYWGRRQLQEEPSVIQDLITKRTLAPTARHSVTESHQAEVALRKLADLIKNIPMVDNRG